MNAQTFLAIIRVATLPFCYRNHNAKFNIERAILTYLCKLTQRANTPGWMDIWSD